MHRELATFERVLSLAYARGTVLYVVVMPTGGTFSSILVAFHSILSHLDRSIRHHTTLADVLSRS